MRGTRNKLLAPFFVLGFLAGMLGFRSAVTAAEPADALKSAWENLVSNEETKATRAILTLARSPKEAIAFLKGNLRPVKADPKQVARWIAELDSDQFTDRDRAQQELEYQGKYIKDALKKALEANPAAETKRRLEHLLETIAIPEKQAAPAAPLAGKGRSISVQNNNGQIRIMVDGVPLDLTPKVIVVGSTLPPTWIRAVRAISILEEIGTPEARQILEQVAGGETKAKPTVEAKAALERLKKK